MTPDKVYVVTRINQSEIHGFALMHYSDSEDVANDLCDELIASDSDSEYYVECVTSADLMERAS